jgi:perosamine synthetase
MAHQKSQQNKIPQFDISFDENDSKAVADVVKGGWISEGPKTNELESRFSSILRSKHCIMTNNGTVALTLALMAIGVGPGDEVIVPDLTFVATANAAILAGARPVFVDVRRDNFCIDWQRVRKRLTSRTKAVVAVHLNGRNAVTAEALEYLEKKRVNLVADAAQTIGSRFHGRGLGTESVVASMSFAPSKRISTGQGGMVFTDSAEIAQRVRRLKDHGRLDKSDYHPTIGFDFKFSDLQAALGLSQLRKLDARVNHFRAVTKLYREELEGLPLTVGHTGDAEELLWYQDVVIRHRRTLAGNLAKLGVGTRKYYKPLTKQPAYKSNGDFPASDYVSEHALWLPSSPGLELEDVKLVCGAVKKSI